jgi:hypothetical protein
MLRPLHFLLLKFPAAFARRLRWINLPGAVLVALLQRTPMVRVAALAEEFVAVSPVGSVLRSVTAAAAALGAVHSLAGATQFVQNPINPVTGTVGQPLSVGFTIVGSPTLPSFFTIGSALPPGLAVSGLLGSNGNPATPIITGTPTQPGTFNVLVTGSDGFYSETNTITFVIASGLAAPPQITTQPASQQVNAGATVVFTVVATGSPAPTFQWRKNGATIPAATGATLTLPGVQLTDAAGYSVVVTNSLSTVTSATAQLTVLTGTVAPGISTQPVSQTAAKGQTVTFTVVATGTPAPNYQWFKNGVAILSATSASLTLPNVQTTDAGNYLVIVTNSAGSVNSSAATLNVNAQEQLPAFTAQPGSQTVATGSTVVFSAAASGAPTPTFQWQRNGTPIAGATSTTLVVNRAAAADAGTYTCVATNIVGPVSSNAATLTLVATADVGRLINLSILTTVTANPGDSFFTVGTVLGGGGPNATKPLLVRAVGPSLVQIGVPGVLADPKLEIFTNGSSFASNDNWGGDAGLAAVFKQVGAFPFIAPSSSDAAVYNPATPAGGSTGYTVQVSGVNGATGTVIAEIYDATPEASFNANTPRLLDVSVLKQLAAGSTITAGFIIGGTTAKTVLVRAIGPGLAQLGVPGFVGDPHVVLFNGASVKIAENDNWGGDPQLNAAMSAAGAFPLADPASKDAVLLLTLPPGNYSAVADGLNNSSGFVIVEVYDVP